MFVFGLYAIHILKCDYEKYSGTNNRFYKCMYVLTNI